MYCVTFSTAVYCISPQQEKSVSADIEERRLSRKICPSLGCIGTLIYCGAVELKIIGFRRGRAIFPQGVPWYLRGVPWVSCAPYILFFTLEWENRPSSPPILQRPGRKETKPVPGREFPSGQSVRFLRSNASQADPRCTCVADTARTAKTKTVPKAYIYFLSQNGVYLRGGYYAGVVFVVFVGGDGGGVSFVATITTTTR